MFRKLANILGTKFNRKDELARQLEIVKVFDLYRKELARLRLRGPEIKLISLKNHTLTVAVGSAVLASELRMRQEEVMGKINATFGKEIVTRIVYRF